MNWIDLTQVRNQCRARVNNVINLRFPKYCRNLEVIRDL
jgi:hypothetical protein